MRVSRTMCLGQLAELMGKEATPREAELMREFLVGVGYDDTELVQESDWVEMVREVVEMAEAETSDGGPTPWISE